MKLSACLVIRNEEKLLQRCLESIKEVVEEIIIVHDGPCHDKSLSIAKSYKARIFICSFIGEAEYHRPFSFEKAQGEWILQIDADEFLSQKAQREIPRLIMDKNIDAYSFLWPYFDGEKYIKKGPFAKTLKACLFRKKKMFMIGISHEYPRTYGVLEKRPDILLEHKPEYDNFTSEIFDEKWTKWAKLQAKQIYNIEKAPTFNIAENVSGKGFAFYTFMRNHPILSAVQETIKFISIYLSRGILFAGKKSILIAYLNLRYIWLLRRELINLKRKINI